MMAENRRRIRGNLLLAFASLIWGSSFVAQSVGMDYIGPFTFNSVRCILGGIVLLPVIALRGKAEKTSGSEEKKRERETLLKGGLACGLAMTMGSMLQQIGIQYTTAGKAGFITALYMLIVPVIGVFLGRKYGWKTWLGVALAVLGMYLLCVKEGFSIAKGDAYVLVCAFAFAVHILVIDYFSPKADGVCLACIQFFVCGTLCGIPMLLFERPSFLEIMSAWQPIAYAGVLSCGVAYTLQIVAQKDTDPTVASLIMSMESVFAVLTGWVVLGETLSRKEGVGCILVFLAVILSQLPESGKGRKSQPDISGSVT